MDRAPSVRPDLSDARVLVAGGAGLSWEPSLSSHEAVRRVTRDLVAEFAPEQRSGAASPESQ